MANNEDLLKNLPISQLKEAIERNLKIEVAASTAADFRRDLNWPPLRQLRDEDKVKAELDRLKEQVDIICYHLKIELPERLKQPMV